MARTVRISVLGMELRLQTDDSEAFVQRVASAVNQRGEAMRQRGLPAQQVAIYAALQLAEELERNRDADAAFRNETAAHVGKIAAQLRQDAAQLLDAGQDEP